jgi:hypothetical protein
LIHAERDKPTYYYLLLHLDSLEEDPFMISAK